MKRGRGGLKLTIQKRKKRTPLISPNAFECNREKAKSITFLILTLNTIQKRQNTTYTALKIPYRRGKIMPSTALKYHTEEAKNNINYCVAETTPKSNHVG